MLEAQVGAVVGRIGDASQRLAGHAAQLVKHLDHSHASSLGQQAQTDQVATALDGISRRGSQITAMSQQIAAAAEQQSAVSEDINRNVVGIRNVGEATVSAG